jgi:hypothetical protein
MHLALSFACESRSSGTRGRNLNSVSKCAYVRKTRCHNNFLAKRNARARGGAPNANFLNAVLISDLALGENDILKVKEEGVNTLLDCDALVNYIEDLFANDGIYPVVSR